MVLEILNVFIIISGYLLVFLLAIATLQNLTSKSTNLFQYKIKNIRLSWFLAITYVSIFIIIFYLLRIFTAGKTVDLKEYYYICLTFINNKNLITLNYIILLILIVIIIYIYLIQKINKFLLNHILKLFLYYYVNYKDKKLSYTKFRDLTTNISTTYSFLGTDPLSYFVLHEIPYLLLLRITYYFEFFWRNNKQNFKDWRFDFFFGNNKRNYKLFNKCMDLTRLVFTKTYYWLFTLSPFIFLILEIIFNNFVIHYIFYFLLLYVPLILLRKFFYFLMYKNYQLIKLLWVIYYVDMPRIFAIPKEPENIKLLWDLYLMNNLQYLGYEVTKQFSDDYLFDITFFNSLDGGTIEFVPYNNEPNLYTNMQIVTKYVDGKLYKVKYDEIRKEDGEYEEITTLEDEWIILYDKIHTWKNSQQKNK